MAKFRKHKITVDGPGTDNFDFYFLAPENSYAGIETETGVTQLAETSDEQRMPTCKVEELVKSGSAIRKYLRVNGTGGRDKYVKCLVADLKNATFNADIIGKSVNGRLVRSVVNRQSANFS